MEKLLLITALVIVPNVLHAEEKEPFAVLQLGGAAAWNLPGGSSFGPAASIEFQVIKNVSVEPGLSLLFNNQGRVDWDFDVVVRRQFDLSETVEFEPGIGPAWGNSGFGATGSLEFMIWPWKDRKLGWFVDSTYTVSFAAGHQQSLGLTVGLLIAIPGN
jgi:hypothetical protein